MSPLVASQPRNLSMRGNRVGIHFFRLQFTHGFPAKLPEWVEAGIQEVCGKQSLTVQLPWECVSGLWTTDHSSFVLAADWRHANMGIFADRALLPVLC